MLSLYCPGDSLVHRTPAWVKLLVICVTGTTVMFISSVLALGVLVLVVASGYAVACIPTSAIWRISRTVVIFLIVIVGFQWLFSSALVAAIVGLRILFLITAANLLTLTTSMSELISTVETILSPFSRFGLRPEKVGIAIGLALRFIPVLIEQGTKIREAQAARGVTAPFTYLVPLIIRTLRMADGVGEALEVRSTSTIEHCSDTVLRRGL